MTAKIDWYREILNLDPASKVFFPLARLLVEEGKGQEAISILEQGLTRHPEFLEARILLVDLLYRNGVKDQCETELKAITPIFSSYPGFWQAWANQLANNPDQVEAAVLVRFLATHFISGPIKLREILNRGLEANVPKLPTTSPDNQQEFENSPRQQPIAEFAENQEEMLEDLDTILEAGKHNTDKPIAEPVMPDSAINADMEEATEAGNTAESAGAFVVEQEILPDMPDEPERDIVTEQKNSPQMPDEPEGNMATAALPNADISLAAPEPNENVPETVLPGSTEAELPLPENEFENLQATKDSDAQDLELTDTDLPDSPDSEEDAEVALDSDDLMGEISGAAPDNDPQADSGDELTAANTEMQPDAEDTFASVMESDASIEPDKTEASNPIEIDTEIEAAAPEATTNENLQENPVSAQIIPENQEELSSPDSENDISPAHQPIVEDSPETVKPKAGNAPLAEADIDAAAARAEADLLADMDLPAMGADNASEMQAGGETPPPDDEDPLVEEYGEEEQVSLRTRSMAEVLAEQGDITGALDIYQELANAATSADELNDINQRIATLKSRITMTNASTGFKAADEEAQARSKEKLIGMLEALAKRVEARAQG